MDNLELLQAFEALAHQPAAQIVQQRLGEMAAAEVCKLADATQPNDMFRAQGRYHAICEINKWFDKDYLRDLKAFLQEKKR